MHRFVTVIIGLTATVSLAAGCSNDTAPASSTSSTVPSSAEATPSSTASTPAVPPAAPPHTVTVTPPARTATTTTVAPNNGGTYNVPCTGPDQGTVCTNPNHGAGDDPSENGTAPTTTSPKVRDDDPGGKPCTTGMGVAGTYIYSEDTNTWVCQIS